jgi:hypothetical protein
MALMEVMKSLSYVDSNTTSWRSTYISRPNAESQPTGMRISRDVSAFPLSATHYIPQNQQWNVKADHYLHPS